MEWILLNQIRNVSLATEIPSTYYATAWLVSGKLKIAEVLSAWRAPNPQKEQISMILSIIAGDIKLNQGTRFQCCLSKKHCKTSNKNIQCGDCEMRFHTTCGKPEYK